MIPVSLVRPPLRVGREREWKAMLRAWAAGRGFLMLGDAGIGKTRLMTDLLQAHAGARIERSRPGDAQKTACRLGCRHDAGTGDGAA